MNNCQNDDDSVLVSVIWVSMIFFWVWNLQELSRVTFSISRRSEFFMSHDSCISLDLGKAVFLQKICSQSILNRDFLDLPTSGAQTFSRAQSASKKCFMFSVEKRAGKRGKLRDLLTGTGNEKRMSLEKSHRISLQSSSRYRYPKMAAQLVLRVLFRTSSKNVFFCKRLALWLSKLF